MRPVKISIEGFSAYRKKVVVDLDDVEFHLIQDIQHVILKIRIRLVDLIDEQHHPFV